MCTLTEGRLMRIVVAVLSTVLTLMGCNERSKTTVVTKTTIDGNAVSSTRATITDALAEFQCIKSASGKCDYVLFVSDCPVADAGSGKNDTDCTTKLVRQFALAAGESKAIADLPKGFKFCVGNTVKPIAPGCLK